MTDDPRLNWPFRHHCCAITVRSLHIPKNCIRSFVVASLLQTSELLTRRSALISAKKPVQGAFKTLEVGRRLVTSRDRLEDLNGLMIFIQRYSVLASHDPIFLQVSRRAREEHGDNCDRRDCHHGADKTKHDRPAHESNDDHQRMEPHRASEYEWVKDEVLHHIGKTHDNNYAERQTLPLDHR